MANDNKEMFDLILKKMDEMKLQFSSQMDEMNSRIDEIDNRLSSRLDKIESKLEKLNDDVSALKAEAIKNGWKINE